MSDYERMLLALRICNVLEGAVVDEIDDNPKLAGVYRYCHLVSGCKAPHSDWMKEFEELEAGLIKNRVIDAI